MKFLHSIVLCLTLSISINKLIAQIDTNSDLSFMSFEALHSEAHEESQPLDKLLSSLWSTWLADPLLKGIESPTTEETTSYRQKASESVQLLMHWMDTTEFDIKAPKPRQPLTNADAKYSYQIPFRLEKLMAESISEKRNSWTSLADYRFLSVFFRERALTALAENQKNPDFSPEEFFFLNVFLMYYTNIIEVADLASRNLILANSSKNDRLSTQTLGFYVIFVLNFLDLEYLDLPIVNKQINSFKLNDIEGLKSIFAQQLRSKDGINVYEASIVFGNILIAYLNIMKHHLDNNEIDAVSLLQIARKLDSVFEKTNTTLHHISQDNSFPIEKDKQLIKTIMRLSLVLDVKNKTDKEYLDFLYKVYLPK